jgi:hypothetical protein
MNKPKEENWKPNHGARTGSDILPAEIFRLGSISAYFESPNSKQKDVTYVPDALFLTLHT